MRMDQPKASATRVSRLPRWLRLTAAALILLGIGSLGVYRLRPDLLLDAEFARQAWWAGASYDAVLVDDHVWVYYERPADSGAKGAPVLLLHGFTGSKENYLPLLAKLEHASRVIVPDLPGWGESSRRELSDYGIAAQVERLERFLDAQRIERVHLVGHSMGGHIAGVFAALHPERVATLALVDTAGVRFEPNEFALRVMRGETPFNVRTRAEFDAFMAQLFAKPPFLPARLKDVLVQRNRRGHAFQSRVLASIGRGPGAFQLEANLDRIQAPTLVLWCRQDQILDVSAIRTLSRIRPRPTVTVLEGCGHMSIMEQPGAAGLALHALWQREPSRGQPMVATR